MICHVGKSMQDPDLQPSSIGRTIATILIYFTYHETSATRVSCRVFDALMNAFRLVLRTLTSEKTIPLYCERRRSVYQVNKQVDKFLP